MASIIENAVPWRIKNAFSRNTPVIYYLVANFFADQNAAANWDQTLCDEWDDVSRTWPRRAEEICRLTAKNEKILDVGCGTGSILRTLLRHWYENLCGYQHSQISVERLSAMGINMRLGRLPSRQ